MKININNKANLPFKKIGELYDEYIEDDRIITIYDGMKEYKLFEYKKKEYKMTIEYKTTQTNVTVEELDIEAKEVSKKGLKFPKLK